MKIKENIYMLECTRKKVLYHDRECDSMVYAVLEADGITLIDSGFPPFAYEILEEIRLLGQHRLSLKQILLTHGDLDHIGNAAWLQDKTGCNVWISQEENVYLTGERKRLPNKQRMCEEFHLQLPRVEFYPPSRMVGDFQIFDTPGHSRGHVCILYRQVLFGGDLFSFSGGSFSGANPEWTEDMEQAARSLDCLRSLKFSMLCPGHGIPDKRRNYL
ncbi:MBL fold metallo-hydrolase [Hominifimenecus sp. rT4P-3]|uniref:MBL fold metallo-hydrolase n=1 Tax=Hominifimenecus sp. rT4P-3 TaxID=3242979 RepID=UPI003DA5B0B3